MSNFLRAASIGALMVAMGSAHALVIDNFDSGSGSVSSSGSPGPSNIPGASGVVGGSRTLEITSSAGGSNVSVNVFPTGQFNHSEQAGSNGTSTVTWDNNGVGLGGVDFTDGSINDALQLNITSIDQGSVTISFVVNDIAAGTASLTLNNLGVGNVAFLFSSFTGLANFSAVDSLVMTVVAGTASDLTLDLVQTRQGTNVPVPGTLALFGAGLLGLGLRRRRTHAA